jgi:hypothetical protein
MSHGPTINEIGKCGHKHFIRHHKLNQQTNISQSYNREIAKDTEVLTTPQKTIAALKHKLLRK